jgi:integrase
MNLSDAIGLYLQDRRAKGAAKNTLRSHERYLRYLLADVGNINTRSLSPRHVDAFWAAHPDLAPGSRNTARACLSAFFTWCRARGHLSRDADPLEGVKKFRVPEKPRVLIPQEEFSTFIASQRDPRRRVIAALGLYTFAGVSELKQLKWRDDLGTHLQVVRDKTGLVDDKPVCEELREELDRWKFAYAAHIGRPLEPLDLIIPGVTGGTYSLAGGRTAIVYHPDRMAALGGTMRDILIDSGYYQPNEGGHTLRRSGARALYDQLSSVGHDRAIRIVQAMLGHRSIANTEIYLRLSLDRKVRDDLLAGKPMFPSGGDATVIKLGRQHDGEARAGGDRV